MAVHQPQPNDVTTDCPIDLYQSSQGAHESVLFVLCFMVRKCFFVSASVIDMTAKRITASQSLVLCITRGGSKDLHFIVPEKFTQATG